MKSKKSGGSAHPSSCSIFTGLCPTPFLRSLPSLHGPFSRRGQARRLSRPCSGQGSWRGCPPCGWGWGRPSWQHWAGAEGCGSEASRTPPMRESCRTGASRRTHAGWKATWSPGRSAGCPRWSCVPLKHDSWEGARPLWEETETAAHLDNKTRL